MTDIRSGYKSNTVAVEDCFMKVSIGNMREFAIKNLDRYGITPFRRILSPEIFQAAAGKPARSSTILIPEVVFWLMATVSLAERSMAGAMTAFWSTFKGQLLFACPNPVTEEAFCIARKKLKLSFFKTIFQSVCQRYQDHFKDSYRWRGFRLLGIDGMKMSLPAAPKLKKCFSVPVNNKGKSKSPQALLVGLVGLWDGICYDFKLTSGKGSEPTCARKLIKRFLGPGDLLMCDRNFPGYHTLALVLWRQANYLFHLPANRFLKLLRTTTASEREDEWYVNLLLPKKLAEQFPFLPQEFRTRIIYYQRKGFRPSYLITSLLDAELYRYDELVNLYHERWRQETMHREWKHSLSLGNLRSTTVRGIFKEVYVQLTLNNVVRWLMSEAAELEKGRPVDFQFLECKRLIMACAQAMAIMATESLPYSYRLLIANISEQKILVRPGRSYPRNNDDKPRNKGNGIYVPPARLCPEERKAI
jgi:Transposase DDE domain